MAEKELSKRVKELRNRKGLSQEILAENSGLSLRTIQRIENGESEPRGDTLKRLADSLNVSADDIIDWGINKDNGFLAFLNLSALAFILFPLFGILIPLIMWISKKDKIKGINQVGKEVINFQITWSIIILIVYIYFVGSAFYRIRQAGDISPSLIGNSAIMYAVFVILYFINFIFVIINTLKIKNEKEVKYFPKINFLR